MPRPDFDEVKKSADLVDAARSRGIELKKSGSRGDLKGLCPFHEDKNPSLIITPAKGLFHCMACGAAGNVVQFVAKFDGITEREAAIKLLETVPGIARGNALETTAKEKTPPAIDPLADPDLFDGILEHYAAALTGRNKSGLDYLAKRGLGDTDALRHFGAGLADGTLKTKLTAAQLETAKVLGLINARGNEKFYNRVVFPIRDATGRAVGLYGRDISGKSEVAHLYLAGGHRAVWNAEAATAYPEELIVAESILDALAIWQRGGKKNVVAAYGARGWTPHHEKLLSSAGTKKLIFAFDADTAGQSRAREIAAELVTKLPFTCHRLRWPGGCKDANDYFLFDPATGAKGDAASFAELLANAPRIGFKREENKAKLTLIEQGSDTAHFKNGTASYKAQGIAGAPGTMKIVLTAMVGEGAEKKHTDRLDLYAARSRAGFGSAAARLLEIAPEKIETHLLEILSTLEKLREDAARPAPKDEEMKEADRAAALKLLKSPNLFKKVAEHVSAAGYVGEDRNKKLAYLIATSRRLPKPLSGIVRSQSGAGKSYLMECVADLMPPEDVHFFSRLTPQALYYLERDALQHKLLVVDERNGSEESEYPIRTLQTRRVLRLAVPVKDPNSGRIKTETLEILGPIAYMESTTSGKINPENANRCFELYLDEGHTQTRAIFAAQRRARTLGGWKIERRKEEIQKLHHDAQRLLRPVKIIIPFVDLLEFPGSWLRGRRDHDRFLSLLEGVAFLHQQQRPSGTDGGADYIEASLEDYAHAYDLAATVFANTLGDLPKPAADLLAEIKKMPAAKVGNAFTRRHVREFTKLPDHVVKRHMRTLEDLEYTDVLRAASGGSHRYKLLPGTAPSPVLAGLTPPADLATRWEEHQKAGQAEHHQNSPTVPV